MALARFRVPGFVGGTQTGAITGVGSQITGLAKRIQVNAALVADPSKLTIYKHRR